MSSTRFNDLKYLYTRDDGLDQLYAQRQFIDSVSNVLLTPVTALFAARVIPTDTKVERPKNLSKRKVIAYIDNPNATTGFSVIDLAIPYQSNDPNHTAQQREILLLPSVLCTDYVGEGTSSFR